MTKSTNTVRGFAGEPRNGAQVAATRSRAFLIRAGFENELVDEFLGNQGAYVGWDQLGDLTGLSPTAIDRLLLEHYPQSVTASGAPNKHHREIVELVCGLEVGDMIVTPHRATRTLLVGQAVGPYEYDKDSNVLSGNEVYRHRIPVRWTHAVSRDDLDKAVFIDTDQRGKTAFRLKPSTVGPIAAAPKRPIEGIHGRSRSGSSTRSSRTSTASKPIRQRKGKRDATEVSPSQPTQPGCSGCATNVLLVSLIVSVGLVGIGLLR